MLSPKYLSPQRMTKLIATNSTDSADRHCFLYSWDENKKEDIFRKYNKRSIKMVDLKTKCFWEIISWKKHYAPRVEHTTL